MDDLVKFAYLSRLKHRFHFNDYNIKWNSRQREIGESLYNYKMANHTIRKSRILKKGCLGSKFIIKEINRYLAK